MMISASRRTDIPAFYSRWLLGRLRDGFCFYPNPYDPRRHHRVDLRPEAVEGIVFWTRDPRPLMKHLAWLDSSGYRYYFQFTVNNYPRSLDPAVPGLKGAARAFRELSERLGPERVIWRYDPLILGGCLDEGWQVRNFLLVMGELGNPGRVTVSVVDPYRRARGGLRRALGGAEFGTESYERLLKRMAEEAGSRGVSVSSCAEPRLRVPGMNPGRCVDAELLAAEGGASSAPPRLHRQREGCLCHRSVDIGCYDTCAFGCVYCYAVKSPSRARTALASHDPGWSCLTCDRGG